MTTVNGNAAPAVDDMAPVTIPPPWRAGPWPDWPPRLDERRARVAHPYRRVIAAGLPVAVVAVVAGVVSYSHIVALSLRAGQSVTDAHLSPIPVDGLIVGGSVILAFGSWLGWLAVVPGVGATLFANVESGLPHGPLGATVSAWPAIAFSIASFVLERWLKSQVGGDGTEPPGDKASDRETAPPVADGRQDQRHDRAWPRRILSRFRRQRQRQERDERADSDDRDERQDERQDEQGDSDKGDGKKDQRQRQRAPSASDKVRDILKRNKALADGIASDDPARRATAKARLAEKAGVSVRTVERVIGDMEGTAS